MPDNLRITTPITNTEGINKPNPTEEPARLAPVNPHRVPQPNGGEDGSGKASDLLLNRSSVYGQFIQQFRQTPGLDRTLEKLLGDLTARMGALPVPGQADAVSELPPSLQALAVSMAAQADGVIKDLAAQRDDATLFTGPLFQLLGRISVQRGDPQFDLRLADFLKAYTGYSTAADTTQAIRANLKELIYSIPVPYAKRLKAVLQKLSDGTSENAEHVESDLAVLKKEIIPLLSEYVTKTNDYGKPRDTISMLLHNTAILNESSRENLAGKFGQLCRYCQESLSLPAATLGMMQSLFVQAVTSGHEAKASGFLSALTSLLARTAEKGDPDGVDRALLGDISRSLLLDSSVYMPFQHIFLPAQIDGRFLFAQIWVEKQDPDDAHKQSAGLAQAPKSVYLSFDIQDLGYFEACVRIAGNQVDMKLACPTALKGFRGEIRSGVAAILEKNGLSVGGLRLSDCTQPKIPQIILQKAEERKDSIDVTV